MQLRAPDYLKQFQCLAGECPHSCCQGWEVVVDEASAAFYRTLPGPLGERLRASLQTEDGEDYFALTDTGRCPFWDMDGLCAIHRALGPERTGEVCRSHPRFIEDYGPLRETSLVASCPEACRLLLSFHAPLTFPETETDEEGESGDPWLDPLLAVRKKLFEILQDPSRKIGFRLSELLALTAEAQILLDKNEAPLLPALCRAWTAPAPGCQMAGEGIFPRAWEALSGLEILGDDWRALLRRGREAVPGAVPEALMERIVAYFLFRYTLKTVNDGDLLGRVQFALLGVLVVERAASLLPLDEALRIYCREIEHNEDNIDALLLAFRTQPALSPSAFFRTLGDDADEGLKSE
ncbi:MULTISPECIES: flagellin lysine-N-methylase [unclassified Oscillibacter]|uniref:flagellin lysine-N-methylase n=1 Tax=unclassified Oscillibacter TaxID=2629304 RepID=UPI0025DE14D8|nr:MULTISPECIES: flagellin lysine-N-methylase [unclassified Oscillibacter]